MSRSHAWNKARYMTTPRRPRKLLLALLIICGLWISSRLLTGLSSDTLDHKPKQRSDVYRPNVQPDSKAIGSKVSRVHEKVQEEEQEIRDKLHLAKHHDTHAPVPKVLPRPGSTNPEDVPTTTPLEDFIKKVMLVLITSKPKTGFQLPRGKRESPDNTYRLYPRQYGSSGIVNIAAHDNRPGVPVLSENFLRNCLMMPKQIYRDLETSHFYVTKWLPKEYPEDVYKGDGIVMVGGGKFSWFVLLAVENLRATGSELPVEVLIPTEQEYEQHLCEDLLPDLNAKCVVLTRRLPFLKQFESIIGGYQYKSLALLSSSFENVLLLDADNLAVANPDRLFHAEPFSSTGMVLWPDYWKRVTHPDFYRIAKYSVSPDRVRYVRDDLTPPELYVSGNENPADDVPLHDRQGAIPDLTTESGQILVNKRTHIKSLLLSLYYNLYGPHQYYPLFSQGGEGEGDKETFLAAAVFYDEPVYRVKKICDTLGYWMENPHKFVGVGMVQHDPVKDFEDTTAYKKFVTQRIDQFREENPNYKKLLHRLWQTINSDSENNFNSFVDRDETPQFYHCNFPKLDPVDLKDHNKLLDENGKEERLYTSRNINFDFEMRQWTLMRKYFCNGDLDLAFYKDQGVHTTEYCQFIDDRIEFLSKNP